MLSDDRVWQSRCARGGSSPVLDGFAIVAPRAYALKGSRRAQPHRSLDGASVRTPGSWSATTARGRPRARRRPQRSWPVSGARPPLRAVVDDAPRALTQLGMAASSHTPGSWSAASLSGCPRARRVPQTPRPASGARLPLRAHVNSAPGAAAQLRWPPAAGLPCRRRSCTVARGRARGRSVPRRFQGPAPRCTPLRAACASPIAAHARAPSVVEGAVARRPNPLPKVGCFRERERERESRSMCGTRGSPKRALDDPLLLDLNETQQSLLELTI
jgi:hypothetical protein